MRWKFYAVGDDGNGGNASDNNSSDDDSGSNNGDNNGENSYDVDLAVMVLTTAEKVEI